MNGYSESLFDVLDPEAVEDLGDIDCEDSDTGFASITSAAADVLSKGRKFLALGGDHSVSYPLLKAINEHHKPPTIVHFDAHPDLYDNFEDNPHSHASPFARIMENGLASRLIQIGIRTINPHQKSQIERFGVQVIEARHFSLAAFETLNVTGPVYVSIDIDALDPAFAPGVSHHEPGGLTTRNIIDVVQSLSGQVISGDIVEYNPRKASHDMTAYVAVKLLKELAASIV